MPRLIVNADDLGMSPGVNAGIVKAIQHGIVRSTTVMINMPYAEVGLQTVMEQAPDAGIGLHINLSDGKPVLDAAEIPSLVDDDNNFLRHDTFLNQAMERDADEIHAEIAAQFERFQKLTGRLPTHMDTHWHVAYLHPFALEAMLSIAASNGNLPLRQYSPFLDDEAHIAGLARFIPEVDANVWRQLLPMQRDVMERLPYNMPTRFDSNFGRDSRALGDLLNILVALPDDADTELLCHPGIEPDDIVENIAQRQQEVESLTHATTHEVIDRYNITLINYAQLESAQ